MSNVFLVTSAEIENVIFWYKTAPSEANVNINEMGSAKWTGNYFFWKLYLG